MGKKYFALICVSIIFILIVKAISFIELSELEESISKGDIVAYQTSDVLYEVIEVKENLAGPAYRCVILPIDQQPMQIRILRKFTDEPATYASIGINYIRLIRKVEHVNRDHNS